MLAVAGVAMHLKWQGTKTHNTHLLFTMTEWGEIQGQIVHMHSSLIDTNFTGSEEIWQLIQEVRTKHLQCRKMATSVSSELGTNFMGLMQECVFKGHCMSTLSSAAGKIIRDTDRTVDCMTAVSTIVANAVTRINIAGPRKKTNSTTFETSIKRSSLVFAPAIHKRVLAIKSTRK